MIKKKKTSNFTLLQIKNDHWFFHILLSSPFEFWQVSDKLSKAEMLWQFPDPGWVWQLPFPVPWTTIFCSTPAMAWWCSSSPVEESMIEEPGFPANTQFHLAPTGNGSSSLSRCYLEHSGAVPTASYPSCRFKSKINDYTVIHLES